MEAQARRRALAAAARSSASLASLLLVVAAASCLLLGACGTDIDVGSLGSVTGSGTPATKTYDYSGFEGLQVDNGFRATVTQGDVFAVSVTVDDNVVEHLRVELDGDTLRIGLDPGYLYSSVSLEATVTMPTLARVEASGAATVGASGFGAGDDLGLDVSGASTVSLGNGFRAGGVELDVSGASAVNGVLDAEAIRGEVSGAGEVSLEGSATTVDVEASGAGRLDLSDVAVQDASLQLSGGATASIRVSGTLDVEASGGARLEYYGSPTLGDVNTSGGAVVERAGP